MKPIKVVKFKITDHEMPNEVLGLMFPLRTFSTSDTLLVSGGKISVKMDIYCTACAEFTVDFGTGEYICRNNLFGWLTGQCLKFKRRIYG